MSTSTAVMIYHNLKNHLSQHLNSRALLPIVTGSILILFALRLYRALASPLRDVPGPFLARFTRLWKLYTIYSGRFEQINILLHKKYGPIVRIAPNEYSIDDPKAASIIYGLGGEFTKSPWYIASGSPDPHAPVDLFSARDPQKHAALRRVVANLYSMTTLVKLEPYIDECSELLIEKFTQFAHTRRTLDMAHWMQCYAFDVIGNITLAKRFGFLERGEDISGIIAAISEYLFYAAHVGVYAEWHSLASRIWPYIFRSGHGRKAMAEFTEIRVKEKLSAENITLADQSCFLSRLIAQHEADGGKTTMVTVLATCRLNIGAGSDTTSISLSSILYHLCKNPHTLQALQQEIDAKEAALEISNPITFQEAQKLPYLQAVIKESLRVHPATGLPLGRVVPKGGKIIAGRMFPEGTIVGINSWVAHANEDIFGTDASSFRPERWLESTERTKSQDKYFFTFGMGSRTCIGKNISLLEISKLIPQLVRQFDIRLDDSSRNWHTKNSWFVKQYGFNCTISIRSKKA